MKTALPNYEPRHHPRRFVLSPADVNAILNKWLKEEINDHEPSVEELAYGDFFRERRSA